MKWRSLKSREHYTLLRGVVVPEILDKYSISSLGIIIPVGKTSPVDWDDAMSNAINCPQKVV